MTKLPLILLGFFALISTLWLLNSWQSSDWQKNLLQNTLPQLEAIEPEELNGYEEFISPDGKLKIKYPGSWLVAENQGLLAAATPQEWQEKYNLETIFLAQYFKADQFAQLMVQEGVFDISNKEIIAEMKKINQEQELSMEIVKSDIRDDKTVFEARHSTTGSPNLYSQEAILSVGEKTYLIAFITLEKNWPEFTEEADFILNSVQIVQ